MRRGIGLDVCGEGDAAGDGGKGSKSGLAQLHRHARWLQRRVDLERQGLVVKVEEMGVGANAGVGMLGSFVVVPGGFGVVGHGWVKSLTMAGQKPNINIEQAPFLTFLLFQVLWT